MDYNSLIQFLKIFIFGNILFIQRTWGETHGDPSTMSFVISKETKDPQDFIQILKPPVHLHRKSIIVEYRCTKKRVVGVEVITDINGIPAERIFTELWNCNENIPPASKKRRVKLKLPDYIQYNYNNLNKEAALAPKTKLRAWILDIKLWPLYKDKRSGYPRALAKVSYDTSILSPFSRPIKYVSIDCRKWSWDILRAISSRNPKCPAEHETIEVIQYPLALNGLPYGVFREFPHYNDKELENHRQSMVTKPRFTLSIWLYILEYCPEAMVPGQLCSIMYHLNQNTAYRTPLLFITPEGRFHVQVTHVNGQASAGVTHIVAPKNQWFRLYFAFDKLAWRIRLSYGKNFNVSVDADFTHPEPVYMDDTEGLFVFGGAEIAYSFKGYIGQGTFFRGRVKDPDRISFPSCYHPMFELKLTKRDEKCQTFLDWAAYKVEDFKKMKQKAALKNSCGNSLSSLLGIKDSKQEQNVCTEVSRHRRSKHWMVANNIIKDLVFKGHSVTKNLIGTKLYDNATKVIEQGIHNIPVIFPLLKQAACCDNNDAMYTVATILNNGIYSKADEIQVKLLIKDILDYRQQTMQEEHAHAYLMKAAMNKHRLASLALGHKHRNGIDAVPVDREQAYAYHKYVADTTRQDKELHKDTDVFTESVRLTDELAIKEQTDEQGDLFNWITHQAKQGVLSAQAQAGRILYWGAQGIKRNLEAAYEYYKMGAETEDPQAMYDYGIVLMRGQGTKKDVAEGLKLIQKSAGKQNPAALNALGWYAMTQEQNYTAAVYYLEKASNAGNADAAYHLGTLHFYGRYPGQEVDKDKAIEYFSIAGSRRNVDGGLGISYLAMLGTPKYPRHVETAVEWARYVAEFNPSIGIVLRKAIQAYRKEDFDVSLFYYFLAAEAGLEVGSFNVAWLCEENKNGITSFIEKDCQWRHYNLSTRREMHHVDSYALIKMGDYYWYGCSGQKDIIKASDYYAEAARKNDPQAYFNLGFMVEEGARIPRDILNKVPIPDIYQRNNVTMLEYLYTRCKESHKSEAYLPCRIALWRVEMMEFWRRYQTWIEVSGMAGVAAITGISIYLLGYTHLRRHNHDLADTI